MSSPAVFEGRTELFLVGLPVTLQHRLGCLPTTEFAEHLEWLVHEVGGELPPRVIPRKNGSPP